jgi:hypothetical protein
MDRSIQATQDVIIAIPIMRRDGTIAKNLQLGQFATKIIKPDGTALTGYTEATFTEPNSDGVYVVKFPTAAAVKAFPTASLLNPYTLTLSSLQEGIMSMTVNIWIVA